MLGVKPEVPPIIVEKYIKEGHLMEDNVDKFRRWWMEYGREGVVRESQVIANYAGTNLLPRHVETEGASIIHGAKHYLRWDPDNHVSHSNGHRSEGR